MIEQPWILARFSQYRRDIVRQKIFRNGPQPLPMGAVELLHMLFKSSHPSTAELSIDLTRGAVASHGDSKFELGQVIHAGSALALLGWDTLPRNLCVSGPPTRVFEHMFDSMTCLRVWRKGVALEGTACRLVDDPRGGWYERYPTVE